MHRKRFMLPAGAALLLVVSTAAPAFATVTLDDNTVYLYSSAQTFDYTTFAPYWSVTAFLPSSSADYLNLLNTGGGLLASSHEHPGLTDFVAVDSNPGTEPYQTYYPVAVYYPNSGAYAIETQDGESIVTIPTPTHQGTTGFADPDLTFMNVQDNQVVSISDIDLTAGESFWASGQGDAGAEMYLLEANPSSPSSFIQSRSAAALDQDTQVIDHCTRYTAQISGWHALVMVTNSWPSGNGQGGEAFALHAVDPTDPVSYCPIADFPAATPAP